MLKPLGSLSELALLALLTVPPLAGVAAGYGTDGLVKYDKADIKSDASNAERDMFVAATERVRASRARSRQKQKKPSASSMLELGLT